MYVCMYVCMYIYIYIGARRQVSHGVQTRLCAQLCLWLRGEEGLGFRVRGLGTCYMHTGLCQQRRVHESFKHTPIYTRGVEEDFCSYGVSFLINTRSLSAVCACECRMCVHECVGGAWAQDTTDLTE